MKHSLIHTSSPFIDPMTACIWELTLRCNAACKFCGSSASQSRPGEMNTAACLELAPEMIDLGLKHLTLSGGEPLMMEGFFDIAKFTIKRDVETSVVSNGLFIDEEMAARLGDLGLRTISLSFDGPGEIHDKLRGVSGAYLKTMKAAEFLAKCGVRVGAVTHINKVNLPTLRQLVDDLVKSPITGWKLQLTVPPVDCEEAYRQQLDPEQLPQVVELVRYVKTNKGYPCYVSDNIGYFGADELLMRGKQRGGPRLWKGCTAGLIDVGITSDGGMLGCLSLLTHGDRFIEGNIKDRSLTEIWRDPNSFAYNRQFQPDQREGHCGECKFLPRCRGGCTCQLASVDPQMKKTDLCLYHVESKKRPIPDRTAPMPLSVVYLVVDGLRPDFINEEICPNIFRLMQNGVHVENARTNAVWAMPAISAMLTGEAAHRLGIIKWSDHWTHAKSDLFSLFSEREYQVASFPFDRPSLFGNIEQANVQGISWNIKRTCNWIIANHRKPTMTFIHWWGTHAPYIDKRPHIVDWRKSIALLLATLDKHRDFSNRLKEMYRNSIRHFDTEILPQILDAINMSAGWDNTLFVLTSGYGESWCERYSDSQKISRIFDLHGKSLYEEALRIPMIIAGAVDKRVINGPATHMDLAHTVANRCFNDFDQAGFNEGIDLFGDIPADRPVFAASDMNLVDEKILPQEPEKLYSLLSCIIGKNKVIKNIQTGEYEWYDLAKDPNELNDFCSNGDRPPIEVMDALNCEWKTVRSISPKQEADL